MAMTEIVQKSLPFAPWADPRTRKLPGIVPLDMVDWLHVDDAYTAQMAERDRLIRDCPGLVHGMTEKAQDASVEVYDLILRLLPPLGFCMDSGQATRPDGMTVPLNRDQPLLTLGRLIQEDICLMQPDGTGEHQLSGAILCFPAGWTLAEKLGRAMMRIHLPVDKYTEDVGRRVQRMLDLVRVDQPLWRANAHHSRAPLFNPLREDAPKDMADGLMPYIRSERQSLIRLPVSRAVVFSIHTYLVRMTDLTPDQNIALKEHPIHRAQ